MQKLNCKLAVSLFFQNREYWQLNYIPRKSKVFIASKNRANHLHNECERLGESSPISIEEIQRFPIILMARLILKGLDKHKMELKYEYSQYCFNITFVFALFNCLKLKKTTDCSPSHPLTILDVEKNAQ